MARISLIKKSTAKVNVKHKILEVDKDVQPAIVQYNELYPFSKIQYGDHQERRS